MNARRFQLPWTSVPELCSSSRENIDKVHDGAGERSLGETEQTNEYYRMNIGCEEKRILITFCENVKTSIQGESRLDNCSLNNEREREFSSHSNRAVCLVQRKSHRFHLCRKDFSPDVLSAKATKASAAGKSMKE